MANVKSFGKRIKELRLSKGFFKQKDLANALGISQVTVSRLEAETSFPRAEIVEHISRVLGADPKEFMIDEEKHKSQMREIISDLVANPNP